MQRYIITFDSTHAAMASHVALAEQAHTLIPVPREISAGCGMALAFDVHDDSEALALRAQIADIGGVAALYRKETCSSYEKLHV